MEKKGHLSARKQIVQEQNKLYAAARVVSEPWVVLVKRAPLSREYIFYWGKK